MKDFSNKYIIIFSVVMVVSVAILLSLMALLLQPRQEKNVEVEKKMNDGDKEATLVFRALAYQLAKDIGSMAAVLRFRVDAIVYTGGMAYSESLCREITSYVSKVAPVICLPGEEEMKSLAEGALRVLHGGKCSEY